MSIAEKLQTIAENEQKVYKAGEIDFINSITSNGEDFSGFYYGKSSSNYATLPAVDTSKCRYFNLMFSDCQLLNKVENLNTSNGINFYGMFYNCKNLTTVPALDTSKGTDLGCMFYYCYQLTASPISNTSNAINVASLFEGCRAIKTLPPLDFSKTISGNTLWAFKGMTALTTIEELTVSADTTYTNTFQNCSKLTNITFKGVIGKNGLSFTNSTLLTIESLRSIIDCLEDKTTDTSGTTWKVTLSTTNLNKLTDEEKAIATAKGWTLA